MNNQTTTVASASEQAATARKGLEGHHPTSERETGPDGPEKGIGGDGERMGRMQTAYFAEADVDAAKLDWVTVNGLRFVPIADRGHADTEGEAMASFAHLNCPACGGSGHVEDVKPANPDAHDRLSLVFPDAPCAVIALGVQAVAEALALPQAVVSLAQELVRAEDDCRALGDAMAVEVTRRDKAERHLADMTTNRDALDEACQRKDARIDQLVAGARTSTAQIADLTTRLNQAGVGELNTTNPNMVETMLLAVADEAKQHRMADPDSWRANRQDSVAHVIRALAAQVADLTAERDAAAENARRERDRRGTYDAEMLCQCAARFEQFILEAGTEFIRSNHHTGEANRRLMVELILRTAGLVTMREAKPVVRVVTSPRFYSEAQAWDAADRVRQHRRGTVVTENDERTADAVAFALGMRRA